MASKFNDVWTRKARALGFPSRAIFKLLEGHKKFRLVKPGAHVIDLGCAPGSWSKLASKLAGPKGFVLGMDQTALSHSEQLDMGVNSGDVGALVLDKKVRGRDTSAKDTDEKDEQSIEKRVSRGRSPVKFLQTDVTKWTPTRALRESFDVVQSDMAPGTSGNPAHDAILSMEQCYSALDQCAQLFKAPVTRRTKLNDEEWKQAQLDQQRGLLRSEQEAKEAATLMKDVVGQEVMELHLKDLEEPDDLKDSIVDEKIVRKILRRNALRQEPDFKHTETELQSREEYTSPVIVEKSWASQIQKGVQVETYYPGTQFMKAFQGEEFPAQFNHIRSIFNVVHTFKPASSRSESVEVFIYAKGYHGPRVHSRQDKAEHVLVGNTKPSLVVKVLESVEDANKKILTWAKDVEVSSITRDLEQGNKKDKKYASKRQSLVLEPSTKYNKEKSLADIYAEIGEGAIYSHEGVQESIDEKKRYQAIVEKTDFKTGIFEHMNSASKDALDAKTRIYDLHDVETSMIAKQNKFLGVKITKKAQTDLSTIKLKNFNANATDKSDDSLFGTIALTTAPDAEQLAKSMMMFWDEGMQFSTKVKEEYGYLESGDFERFSDDE